MVTLRSAPNTLRYFTFGRSLASASSSSSSASGSPSDDRNASSATNESTEAISASAHTAWPRTNGSGSASAAIKHRDRLGRAPVSERDCHVASEAGSSSPTHRGAPENASQPHPWT
jgi:hypothetical protein